MSDISMPPEHSAPAPAPENSRRKYLLDYLPVKFLVLIVGYISPLPVAIMIAQLWLGRMHDDVASPVRVASDALDGTNGAPQWIWPLAFAPALLLFAISFKSATGKIAALVSLLLVSFALIWGFFQYQPTILP